MCTGHGGLDLAVLAVLDAAPAWCAQNDRHASAILAARFPGVLNLGDLTRVDWAAVPPVDLVTAGFPCQDISTAGQGAGIEKGTRSDLWTHIAQAAPTAHEHGPSGQVEATSSPPQAAPLRGT